MIPFQIMSGAAGGGELAGRQRIGPDPAAHELAAEVAGPAEALPTLSGGAVDLSFARCSDDLEWGFVQTHGDRRWGFNDSAMLDYSRRAHLDANPFRLLEIIGERLGQSGRNVGLDIAGGSKATALRELLDSGVLGHAVVTNYQDRRGRKVKRDHRLDHVKGDITRRSTWEEIVERQQERAPEGFKLIMHRPMGALQQLPVDFYRGGLHAALDMLAAGGVLFTQVPDRLDTQPQHLETVCASLAERSDIERMVKSGPKPRYAWPNDFKPSVVILKR